MSRKYRFQLAAMFAALSTVYIYGAYVEHGAFAQLCGATGFLSLATFHGIKAFRQN